MKSIDEDQIEDTLETRLERRKAEIEQAAVTGAETHNQLLEKTLKDFHCTQLNPNNNIKPEQ